MNCSISTELETVIGLVSLSVMTILVIAYNIKYYIDTRK